MYLFSQKKQVFLLAFFIEYALNYTNCFKAFSKAAAETFVLAAFKECAFSNAFLMVLDVSSKTLVSFIGTLFSIKYAKTRAIPQFEMKSGIKLILESTYSIIGPKKISLSAKGTFAPQEITSNPELIIASTCYFVIKREAAHGANTSAPILQILSLISAKGIMLSATKVFPFLFKNNVLISSKEYPSSFIIPPSRSIIPTTLAPICAK